jgi:hypothetical protein
MLLLCQNCAGQPYLPDAPLASEIAGTVTACSAAAGSATSSVITAAELQQTRAANLYDIIRRLRPGYFSIRGPSSILNEPADAIVVIVNRHIIGGVDELRSMQAINLMCVRRLPAAEVSLITGTLGWADGIELVHAGR